MIDAVSLDCRFAIRQLRRNPGFTAVAVLTLALGIGANTAIFSILDPLLLRKLPVHDPEELVWVNSTGTLGPAEISEVEMFRVYREKAAVFSSVLAFSGIAPYQVTLNGRTVEAQGELVSGNYFTALGVRPFAGRLFTDADEHRPTLVVSFDFWRRELSSDRSAIGKMIQFGDRRTYTLMGVAPPGFFGTDVGESPDFFVSFSAVEQAPFVKMLARLKPGISIPQAEAGLQPLLLEVEKTSEIPEVERKEFFARVLLTPASRGLSAARTKFSLPARVLMMVVGLLLLIACGNVANLLLARGLARKREISVRVALGAGRWRVIRQLLTESALIAAAGAAPGVAVGEWASRLLIASVSTPQFPIVLTPGLNERLLFFAAAVLVLTVVICGLVPALSATHGDLADDLRTQGSGWQPKSRLRHVLIVGQVALSMTLLAGGGLLLRSLFNLETFDAGFDRDRVLMVSLKGYTASPTPGRVAAFYSSLMERVKQIPGVHSASYSSFAPISGKEVGINITVEGYTPRPGELANERFVGVSPGYFETMGIPLLEGRDFTPRDTSVAIINLTMAHRFFGDVNPVGKHFRFVEGKRPPLEIIGVVAASKYKDLREPATDFFYIPGARGDLEVRADVPAKTLAGPLREVIHGLDKTVGVGSIRTLREAVDESLHSDRMIAAMCGVFSLLALALTAVGLYGVLAHDVARRSGEISIRMALGARRGDILHLVLGQGMRLTFFGLALGIPAALGAGSLLGGLLFGVRQTDPVTFAGVSGILLTAAGIACYLPARRATRVAPMDALRSE